MTVGLPSRRAAAGSGADRQKDHQNASGIMPPATSHAQQQLPVFLFPSALSFAVDESAAHKLLLTLYNPYDFAVSYRGLFVTKSTYRYSVKFY